MDVSPGVQCENYAMHCVRDLGGRGGGEAQTLAEMRLGVCVGENLAVSAAPPAEQCVRVNWQKCLPTGCMSRPWRPSLKPEVLTALRYSLGGGTSPASTCVSRITGASITAA